MGNDHEIKDLDSQKSRDFFLEREIAEAESAPRLYSLREEYESTRKNISYTFYIVMLAFLGAVGGLAYVATVYIGFQSDKIDLNLMEFQDLNLKAALEASRNQEKRLEIARNALASLEKEKRESLERLAKQGEEARKKIQSGKANAREKKKLILAQRKKEAGEKNKIRNEFDERLAAKRKEVKKLAREAAASKENMKKRVERAHVLVNNFNRLMQLKLKRERAYYNNRIRRLENMYNPVFYEDELKEILAKSFSPGGEAMPWNIPHEKILVKEGVLSSEERALRLERGRDMQLLLLRLGKIPYRDKSVGRSLKLIEARLRERELAERTMLERVARRMKNKNNEFSSYRYALSELTKRRSESGFIIDPRNKNEILIHLNRVLEVKDGTRADVFRGDDEYIGEIEILAGRKGRYAKLIELGPRQSPPRPFDQILIRLK